MKRKLIVVMVVSALVALASVAQAFAGADGLHW